MTQGFGVLNERITHLLDVVKEQGKQHVDSHHHATELEYPEPVLLDNYLKSDLFHGIHLLPEPPLLTGVFNFRQTDIPEHNLYGVHQPSVEGINLVLEHLITTKRHKRVVWINLREEPVLYINNGSFAPREPDTLNENIDYLFSITGKELDVMERRLKRDVLEKSKQNDGYFEIYSQVENMENIILKQPIEDHSVKTLKEVFADARDQVHRNFGAELEYYRIPIQDETAPEEVNFEELVHIFLQEHLSFEEKNTAFVFNCQMGRGRTSTGLTIGTLIMRRLMPGHSVSYDSLQIHDFRHGPVLVGEHYSGDLKNGEFRVILNLIKALEHGPGIKAQVDWAIDKCASIQNLRTAILDCKKKAGAAQLSMDTYVPLTSSTALEQLNLPATFWLKRGQNYLERYWWLIVFNAYIENQAPAQFKKPFTTWIRNRWGLKRMLKKLTLD